MSQPPNAFSQFGPFSPEAEAALDDTYACAAKFGALSIDCSVILYALAQNLLRTSQSSGSRLLDWLLAQSGALSGLEGTIKAAWNRRNTGGRLSSVRPPSQSHLPIDNEALEPLQFARRTWPSMPRSIPQLLLALLETSSIARETLGALTTDIERDLISINAELRESINNFINFIAPDSLRPGNKPGNKPPTWLPERVAATPKALFANFHVSLRDEIIRGIFTSGGRFPLVIAARLGEPTGSYLGMRTPMIGQVLADFLSWPDIDERRIAPLRPNQEVYLMSCQRLIDCTIEAREDEDILTQVAGHVSDHGGLLLLKDLELLAADYNDENDVRSAKETLRRQFRHLGRLMGPNIAEQSLVAVALFKRDPRDTHVENPVQDSLQFRVNDDMILISVKRYTMSRAIGSVRDYHLKSWLINNFTVAGLDSITSLQGRAIDLVQTLDDTRSRKQLGSVFDTHLRQAFADLIALEHGAYVHSERMRAPYFFIEVVNELMEIINSALQTHSQDLRVRELAFQAVQSVNSLPGKVTSDTPGDVRNHYSPLLNSIRTRLEVLSSPSNSRDELVRRDSYGRVILTRDMMTACFLGSNKSHFKWPYTLPEPVDGSPVPDPEEFDNPDAEF